MYLRKNPRREGELPYFVISVLFQTFRLLPRTASLGVPPSSSPECDKMLN